MDYKTLQSIIKNFKGKNLALEIFRHSLLKQQRMIFDAIPIEREKAKSCAELSTELGVDVKNVATQLKQIQAKFGDIKSIRVNKRNRYYI